MHVVHLKYMEKNRVKKYRISAQFQLVCSINIYILFSPLCLFNAVFSDIKDTTNNLYFSNSLSVCCLYREIKDSIYECFHISHISMFIYL